MAEKHLLQWSTSLTTPSTNEAPRRPLTEEDRVFLRQALESMAGPSDAKKMQEAMRTIQDTSLTVAQRTNAADDFEQLVEQIDNACDLTPLKLWQPLISVLKEESEAPLRMYAAWILGTAVQNNEKAQKAFLEEGGVEAVVHALTQETVSSVKAKILYCLSSFIKNFDAARNAFFSHPGSMDALHNCLLSEDNSVRNKIVFLLRILIELDASVALHLDEKAQYLMESLHQQLMNMNNANSDLESTELSLLALVAFVRALPAERAIAWHSRTQLALNAAISLHGDSLDAELKQVQFS